MHDFDEPFASCNITNSYFTNYNYRRNLTDCHLNEIGDDMSYIGNAELANLELIKFYK